MLESKKKSFEFFERKYVNKARKQKKNKEKQFMSQCKDYGFFGYSIDNNTIDKIGQKRSPLFPLIPCLEKDNGSETPSSSLELENLDRGE